MDFRVHIKAHKKGAVNNMLQLRFSIVFYFLLRFTVTATAAAAAHKVAAAEPIAAYLPEVFGMLPAFTVLPSEGAVSSVPAGTAAAPVKSTVGLIADKSMF